MSAFMQDVARASLPVAVALLGFAAAARGVLWAQIDHVQTQRLARDYAEPLGTWCLIALGTYLFALTAGGNAGVLSLVLTVALGVAAVLLRSPGETTQASEAEPPEPPAAPAPPAAPPAPSGRLWVGPARRAAAPARGSVEPMSFASPVFLIGLALIPLAVLLYVRAERRPQAFAPALLLPSVVPRRAGWRRHAAVFGYGAALAALLVALAKPQTTIAVPTEQARVMIVTDRSGSMLADDVAPNRLAAAKKAAATFLDAVPDKVRVGAVAFNHKAEVLQSPTRDHDAVREALQSVKAAGSTATGDAISAALNSIKGRAPAAIVLLSDGKSVRGSDPLAAAQKAKQRKIPIYTVALGTASGTINDGEPVPPDPQTLAQIAKLTGGRAFTAGDVKALDQVYKRLGSQVATEKRKLEVTNLFAGGALALMFLSSLSSIRMFGRLI